MRVRFGDFTLDDDTRQVLRRSAVVHLTPKAFDLLATLIRERPRAVAKTELHARLWPKTFVSDASLAMLVAEVRAALGENARQPRCVRTVHRHGYAFQADARDVPPGPGHPAAASGTEAAVSFWLVTAAQQIPLLPGENIIGRDPRARVWLDSPSVSRHHARIWIEGDRATIEDLGSKNGTRADDVRVTAVVRIDDGTDLHFGSVRATVRAGTADPTRSEEGPTS